MPKGLNGGWKINFQETVLTFGGIISGEKIVPMCSSCNSQSYEFSLKGATGIPSANISKTCGKN